MSNNVRLAGIASFTIDGVAFNITEADYSTSTVTRETLKSLTGIDGYKEMPQQGHIKVSLRDTGGFSTSDFNAMTGSTVQLVLANGKTILGSNMWTVETQTAKAEDATLEVTFESDDVTEQTA